MSRRILAVVIVVVAVVAIAVLAQASCGDKPDAERPRDAAAGDAGGTADAGSNDPAVAIPHAGNLPDPSLGEERLWEPDFGDPELYSTKHFAKERAVHRSFQRELGDSLNLCFDDLRGQPEPFRARLVFRVDADLAPGAKLSLSLKNLDVTGAGGEGRPQRELPPYVYQCLWSAVEAVEVGIPITSAPIFLDARTSELQFPFDVDIAADEPPLMGELDAGTPEEVEPAGIADAGEGGQTGEGPDAAPALQ